MCARIVSIGYVMTVPEAPATAPAETGNQSLHRNVLGDLKFRTAATWLSIVGREQRFGTKLLVEYPGASFLGEVYNAFLI